MSDTQTAERLAEIVAQARAASHFRAIRPQGVMPLEMFQTIARLADQRDALSEERDGLLEALELNVADAKAAFDNQEGYMAALGSVEHRSRKALAACGTGDGRDEAARLVMEEGRSVSAPPEFLTGDEGEVVFIRADLADSVTSARGLALAEGYNLADFDADVVEMLPVPEHFTAIEYEWATVKYGTPGGVPFWRFQL